MYPFEAFDRERQVQRAATRDFDLGIGGACEPATFLGKFGPPSPPASRWTPVDAAGRMRLKRGPEAECLWKIQEIHFIVNNQILVVIFHSKDRRAQPECRAHPHSAATLFFDASATSSVAISWSTMTVLATLARITAFRAATFLRPAAITIVSPLRKSSSETPMRRE